MSWERSKRTNVVDQNTFYLLADVHFLFFSFLFHFLEMEETWREEKTTRCLQGWWLWGEFAYEKPWLQNRRKCRREREDLLKKQREEDRREGRKEPLNATGKIISRNTPPSILAFNLVEGYFFRISKTCEKFSFLARISFPFLFIFCFGSSKHFYVPKLKHVQSDISAMGFIGCKMLSRKMTHFGVAWYQIALLSFRKDCFIACPSLFSRMSVVLCRCNQETFGSISSWDILRSIWYEGRGVR